MMKEIVQEIADDVRFRLHVLCVIDRCKIVDYGKSRGTVNMVVNSDQ